MIKFLYKVLHYEPSSEHKENVMMSLHFICALASTFPVGLTYLVYKKTPEKDSTIDTLFFATAVLFIGLSYYIIVSRNSKMFIETELGQHYFKFGRYTNIVKPFILVIMFALVFLLGRIIFIFFS